jgi:hypothetical protein
MRSAFSMRVRRAVWLWRRLGRTVMPFNPFRADFQVMGAAVEDEPFFAGEIFRFFANDIACIVGEHMPFLQL